MSEVMYNITKKAYDLIANEVWGIKKFCQKSDVKLAPGRLVDTKEHKLNRFLGEYFNLIFTEEEVEGVMLFLNGVLIDKSNISLIVINELGEIKEL